MQNHKYSLQDIENMIPWEREIYIDMLAQQMQEEREQQQKQNMK